MKFYQFCPLILQNLYFFVTTKKLGSDLERLHFQMFSAKRRKFKIGERDGHGKSRNGHGKICCQICGNPVPDLHIPYINIQAVKVRWA